MTTTYSLPPRLRHSEAGYSLAELMIATGLLSLIMAATLAGLASATQSYSTVMNMTSMNSSIRTGLDLMVRDMLQVGSGLPPSHAIEIPSGTGATPVRLPGPPGTAWTLPSGDLDIGAVIATPGGGPTLNGVATDVVTVLMADNAFIDVPLTALTPTTITVGPGPDLATGPDRVIEGQLMMVTKGSATTLLEVTSVDPGARVLTFSSGDSLNLNQPGAEFGTLATVDAADPPNEPSLTRVSRVRMITYYVDADTDPARPRLVRRINNGHPTTFDNTLGNTVAFEVEGLYLTYDIVDGDTNPADVRMTAADRSGSGRCSPNACSDTQIRKINISITGRSKDRSAVEWTYHNTLTSQVSFRGMAFVDEYKAPGT